MVGYHLEIMFRTLFKSVLFGAFCLGGLTLGQTESAEQTSSAPTPVQQAAVENHVAPLSLEKIQQDVREKEQIIDSLNLPKKDA